MTDIPETLRNLHLHLRRMKQFVLRELIVTGEETARMRLLEMVTFGELFPEEAVAIGQQLGLVQL